jgi:hypothetical protein
MERFYDEVSKSLAGSVSRRESLRRMGAVLAGAALGQFGMGTAWAAKANPCKEFCNRCRTAKQKNQCLAACKACNNNTSRLCGSCGAYACCGAGASCCGNHCADLASDFDNCGGCGAACDDPGPWEYGACIDGACVYDCVDGATVCNGACTDLLWDSNNCGDCGIVCGGDTPLCLEGACGSDCPPGTDFLFDATNCGSCGHQCQPLEFCSWGVCEGL